MGTFDPGVCPLIELDLTVSKNPNAISQQLNWLLRRPMWSLANLFPVVKVIGVFQLLLQKVSRGLIFLVPALNKY